MENFGDWQEGETEIEIGGDTENQWPVRQFRVRMLLRA
jgi:hypothetical protein